MPLDSVDFEMHGDEAFVKALERLPEALARHVQGGGALEVAKIIRKSARTLVPVKTGALKKSIRVRQVSQKIQIKILGPPVRVPRSASQALAGNQAGAFHGHFVEYGTIRSRAQPFLEPAVRTNHSQFLRAYAEGSQKRFAAAMRSIRAGTESRQIQRLL